MRPCKNCGEAIESDDGGAIWYHADTAAHYCDGDDERARSWAETAEHAAPEKIDEDEAYELYDEWLNEMDGGIEVAGCVFDASRILKELDPIAYRCGFHDWLDFEGIEVEW